MAVPSLVAERGFSGWWLWPAGHLAGERRPSSCLLCEPSSTQPAKQHRLDVMPLGNCRLQEAANIMIACIFYEDMTWASLAGSSIRTSAQFLLFSQNNIGTVGFFEDFALLCSFDQGAQCWMRRGIWWGVEQRRKSQIKTISASPPSKLTKLLLHEVYMWKPTKQCTIQISLGVSSLEFCYLCSSVSARI